MKIIVASDIHGNLKYTNRLDKLIEKENPDKLVLLGDLYYHGPRNPIPSEYDTMAVCQILNKYKDRIVSVRGNCDAEVDNMISEFDVSKDYDEIILDGVTFFITHGHLLRDLDDIIKDNYVFCGHTHVYNLTGKRLNPGSVGIPKVNKEHTVILYEDRKISLVDLDNYSVIDYMKV